MPSAGIPTCAEDGNGPATIVDNLMISAWGGPAKTEGDISQLPLEGPHL